MTRHQQLINVPYSISYNHKIFLATRMQPNGKREDEFIAERDVRTLNYFRK